MLVVLAIIAWYLVGLSGFYFWWTRDHGQLVTHYPELGMKVDARPTMALAAVLGPLAWIVGYFIHGRD